MHNVNKIPARFLSPAVFRIQKIHILDAFKGDCLQKIFLKQLGGEIVKSHGIILRHPPVDIKSKSKQVGNENGGLGIKQHQIGSGTDPHGNPLVFRKIIVYQPDIMLDFLLKSAQLRLQDPVENFGFKHCIQTVRIERELVNKFCIFHNLLPHIPLPTSLILMIFDVSCRYNSRFLHPPHPPRKYIPGCEDLRHG